MLVVVLYLCDPVFVNLVALFPDETFSSTGVMDILS